jgi:protein-disulfide isomerase
MLRIILFLLTLIPWILFWGCGKEQPKSFRFKDTILPSDVSITMALRDEAYRDKIVALAKSKQFQNPEEWYIHEKSSIQEDELNLFYTNYRPDTSLIGDVEAVSSYRKEILHRMAWKKIFDDSGIPYEKFSRKRNSIVKEQVHLESSPYLGPELATLQVIEFTDFQCYYCSKSQSVKKEVLKKYKNIKWYFKHFPLQDIHENAYLAHIGASCAYRTQKEKFWDYYDLLFANHNSLEKKFLLKYAERAGLDVEKWKSCMNDPIEKKKIISEIDSDLLEGRKLGVQGTPVFIVGNRMVKGFHSFSDWQKIIEEEIKE